MPQAAGTVISIVGARRCTKYGEDIAYRLAYALAEQGVVIISGMAYGIDTAAHRGCLDAGGTTVAVLGTPIDKIYPQSNRRLAERILQNGAILSEYSPETETRAWHFLHRNRIVVGLSDATIIVEAGERSGTQRTAQCAVELGRNLYAVPGDIMRPTSAGCNKLLKMGAHPIVGIEDFLIDLFGASIVRRRRKNQQLNQLSGLARQIVHELEKGACASGELIERLKIDATDFNQQISLLELSGIVQSFGVSSWMLRPD